jgi:hypothetical protein
VPLTTRLLILAISAQVLLTFAILILMGRERVPRVISGEIPWQDVAVERTAYPLRARLLSNNFDNQFQLPVLFYVAALLALWSGTTGWVEVVLAWLFVALRYVHAVIHTTSNSLLPRFSAYTAGMVVLIVLWLWLVVRLVILSPSI